MRNYTKMHILFEDTGSILSIDLATNQVENWLFDEPIEFVHKTSDECFLKFEKQGSNELITYKGYVPNFFSGEHYGDYIMLEISEKGVVQDFKVTDSDIDEMFEELKKYTNFDSDID
jgi:hypothetical protein